MRNVWISERDSLITEASEAIIILKSELLVSSVRKCGIVKGRVTQALGVALIHTFLMKLE